MFSRRLARSRSAAKQQGSAALAPELCWVPPPTQAIYRVGYGVDPFADTRTIDKRGPSETIHPHNPGLMEAARLLRLTIEGVASGHHIRP